MNPSLPYTISGAPRINSIVTKALTTVAFRYLSLFFFFKEPTSLFTFFFFFWPHHVVCRLFPDQEYNPCPLQWNQSLNHWTTREVPRCILIDKLCHYTFCRVLVSVSYFTPHIFGLLCLYHLIVFVFFFLSPFPDTSC